MTPTARLWAAIQLCPPPMPQIVASWQRAGVRHLTTYAEVLRAAPRPIHVWRKRKRASWGWTAACRLCDWSLITQRLDQCCHNEALRAGLDHLHAYHGCPSRAITGEPCHTTCIHCRGWQWCAAPTTERSDW